MGAWERTDGRRGHGGLQNGRPPGNASGAVLAQQRPTCLLFRGQSRTQMKRQRAGGRNRARHPRPPAPARSFPASSRGRKETSGSS